MSYFFPVPPDVPTVQAKTNTNTSSIRHLAYVILSKSLLQGHHLIYICKITGVMLKDLFESSHKPNESARTKKIFLLVKYIMMSTETHLLDRIPSHFNPVTSFTQ